MTSFDEVVRRWDEAARTGGKAVIHPCGLTSDAAYDESGAIQAQQIAEHLESGALVADFGCGDGRVLIPLLALGVNVIGVDSSAAMLERLRVRKPDIEAYQSDGRDLVGVLLSRVDAVYSLATLIHHSHADAAELMRSLLGAVRPGGLLLLDLAVGKVSADGGGWTNVTTWTADEVRGFAWGAGLEVVQCGSGLLTILKKTD